MTSKDSEVGAGKSHHESAHASPEIPGLGNSLSFLFPKFLQPTKTTNDNEILPINKYPKTFKDLSKKKRTILIRSVENWLSSNKPNIAGYCDVSRDSPGSRKTKIYYEIYGNGPKKLFLVMGMLGSTDFWKIQSIYFSKKSEYQVCVFDNRGSGRSSIGKGPYSTTEMAIDSLLLLKHLDWKDNVHLQGVSLGGMIVQKMCLLAYCFYSKDTGEFNSFEESLKKYHSSSIFINSNDNGFPTSPISVSKKNLSETSFNSNGSTNSEISENYCNLFKTVTLVNTYQSFVGVVPTKKGFLLALNGLSLLSGNVEPLLDLVFSKEWLSEKFDPNVYYFNIDEKDAQSFDFINRHVLAAVFKVIRRNIFVDKSRNPNRIESLVPGSKTSQKLDVSDKNLKTKVSTPIFENQPKKVKKGLMKISKIRKNPKVSEDKPRLSNCSNPDKISSENNVEPDYLFENQDDDFESMNHDMVSSRCSGSEEPATESLHSSCEGSKSESHKTKSSIKIEDPALSKNKEAQNNLNPFKINFGKSHSESKNNPSSGKKLFQIKSPSFNCPENKNAKSHKPDSPSVVDSFLSNLNPFRTNSNSKNRTEPNDSHSVAANLSQVPKSHEKNENLDSFKHKKTDENFLEKKFSIILKKTGQTSSKGTKHEDSGKSKSSGGWDPTSRINILDGFKSHAGDMYQFTAAAGHNVSYDEAKLMVVRNPGTRFMVIHGSQDNVIRLSYCRNLAHSLDSFYTTIYGAGHMPMFDAPQTFNTIFEAFVNDYDWLKVPLDDKSSYVKLVGVNNNQAVLKAVELDFIHSTGSSSSKKIKFMSFHSSSFNPLDKVTLNKNFRNTLNSGHMNFFKKIHTNYQNEGSLVHKSFSENASPVPMSTSSTPSSKEEIDIKYSFSDQNFKPISGSSLQSSGDYRENSIQSWESISLSEVVEVQKNLNSGKYKSFSDFLPPKEKKSLYEDNSISSRISPPTPESTFDSNDVTHSPLSYSNDQSYPSVSVHSPNIDTLVEKVKIFYINRETSSVSNNTNNSANLIDNTLSILNTSTSLRLLQKSIYNFFPKIFRSKTFPLSYTPYFERDKKNQYSKDFVKEDFKFSGATSVKSLSLPQENPFITDELKNDNTNSTKVSIADAQNQELTASKDLHSSDESSKFKLYKVRRVQNASSESPVESLWKNQIINNTVIEIDPSELDLLFDNQFKVQKFFSTGKNKKPIVNKTWLDHAFH
ncbi:putative aminoacrylate hydrolase RutD [Smittium mucronatum]|uniref:Putative aminoacrylate hydrolase RutD n=1 Tax=Smittium mucronatum TaxID=133383 RepID=A0A1R0GPZ4_9FUNG|nr:putative aminoacrylate hydrolase RutD [Smittium mucronatum]